MPRLRRLLSPAMLVICGAMKSTAVFRAKLADEMGGIVPPVGHSANVNVYFDKPKVHNLVFVFYYRLRFVIPRVMKTKRTRGEGAVPV